MGCTMVKKNSPISAPQKEQKIKEIKKRVKNTWTCPNCMTVFISGSLFSHMDSHIRICITQADEPANSSENSNSKNPNDITSRQNEHSQKKKEEQFFQKRPEDQQGITYSWVKVTDESKLLNSKIKNLKLQEIKNCPFQAKQKWFRNHIECYRISWEQGSQWLQIEKSNVLMNSIAQISRVNMYKELKIKFIGEKANDAGGLLREWIHLANKQIFDSNLGLFTRAQTDELTYKLKPSDQKMSMDKEFQTSVLTLYGKILGKALFEKIPIQTYLDKTLLRQLCGQEIQLRDLYSFDKDVQIRKTQLYKSWHYLLETKIQTLNSDLNFSIIMKNPKTNKMYDHELKANGMNEIVTDSNKKQFIERCIKFMCYQQVRQSVQHIKQGFHSVIPQKLISIFEPHEMQMMLYGVPFIDIRDWEQNTDYQGAFYSTHKTISWFWEFMRKQSQQNLAKFLQFCTGTTRAPIQGFKKLQTNRGEHSKFVIQSTTYDTNNPYPKAHTCFNRLQLPVYPHKAILNKYIQFILDANLQGVYGLD